MVVIGLLLIAVALAVGLSIVVENTGSTELEVFGVTVDATGTGVFLTGAATMLALLLGVWLVQGGLARARRRRAEVKALRAERGAEAERLEAERARLAEEKARLEREREHQRVAASSTTARPSGPSDTSDPTLVHQPVAQPTADGATTEDHAERGHRSGRRLPFGR